MRVIKEHASYADHVEACIFQGSVKYVPLGKSLLDHMYAMLYKPFSFSECSLVMNLTSDTIFRLRSHHERPETSQFYFHNGGSLRLPIKSVDSNAEGAERNFSSGPHHTVYCVFVL